MSIYLLAGLTFFAHSQDLIVKSNGSGIRVNIIKVTDDSVKFRNAYTDDDFIFTIAQIEVKYIEYENGDVEHFVGSYQNLSFRDSTNAINHIDFDNIQLVVDSVLITFQNLFSQYHLIFDFNHYSDINLVVDKGKVLFLLENEKKSFTERCYPTDEKIIFSKFVPIYPTSKKHFIRLSELKVKVITISIDEKNIDLYLTKEQSEILKEMFLSNQIPE